MDQFSSQNILDQAIARSSVPLSTASNQLENAIQRGQPALEEASSRMNNAISRQDVYLNDARDRLNAGIARTGMALPLTPVSKKEQALPQRVQEKEARLQERSAQKLQVLSQAQELELDAMTQSGFREVADIPLKFAQGVVMGSRMIADTMGADNELSQSLRGVEEDIGALFSAQSKQDSAEVGRIMAAAEDKGIIEQLKAALHAFTVAPLDLVANAFGTSAPVIAGTILTAMTGGGTIAVGATTVGLGALTGVGVTKGAIYDSTFAAFKEEGASDEVAKEIAVQAQEYDGENIDLMLTGGALGIIASRSGIEPGLIKNAVQRVTGKLVAESAKGAAKKSAIKEGLRSTAEEGITEAFQGGHEQFSGNVAQRRAGLDTPLMRGVVSQGALEGLAGTAVGSVSSPAAVVRAAGDTVAKGVTNVAESVNKNVDKKKDKENAFSFANLKKGVVGLKDTAADFVKEGKEVLLSEKKVAEATKTKESVEKAIDPTNTEYTPREKVDIISSEFARPDADAKPEEVIAHRYKVLGALSGYYTDLKKAKAELEGSKDPADQAKVKQLAGGMLVLINKVNQLSAINAEEITASIDYSKIVDEIKEQGVLPNEIAFVLGSDGDGGANISTESLKKLKTKGVLSPQQEVIVDSQLDINDRIEKAQVALNQVNKGRPEADKVSLEVINGSNDNAGFNTYKQRITASKKMNDTASVKSAISGLNNFLKLQKTKLKNITALRDAAMVVQNNNANPTEAQLDALDAIVAKVVQEHNFTYNGKIGSVTNFQKLLIAEVAVGESIAKQAKHIAALGPQKGKAAPASVAGKGAVEPTVEAPVEKTKNIKTEEAAAVAVPVKPGTEASTAALTENTTKAYTQAIEALTALTPAQKKKIKATDLGKSVMAFVENGKAPTEAQAQTIVNYASVDLADALGVAPNKDNKDKDRKKTSKPTSNEARAPTTNKVGDTVEVEVSAFTYEAKIKKIDANTTTVQIIGVDSFPDPIKVTHSSILKNPDLEQRKEDFEKKFPTQRKKKAKDTYIDPKTSTDSRRNTGYSLTDTILEEAGDNYNTRNDLVKHGSNILKKFFKKKKSTALRLKNNVLHSIENWAERTVGKVDETHSELSDEAKQMLESFLDFDSIMRKAYIEGLSSEDGDTAPLLAALTTENQRRFKEAQVMPLFYRKVADKLEGVEPKDLLNPNMISQMNAVMFKWLGSFGKSTLSMNKADVQTIFDLREAKITPTQEMYEVTGKLGADLADTAENLGLDVIEALGLSFNGENVTERYKSKVAYTLGFNMLSAALNADLMEGTAIEESEIVRIKNKFNAERKLAEGKTTTKSKKKQTEFVINKSLGKRRFIKVKHIQVKKEDAEDTANDIAPAPQVATFIDAFNSAKEDFSNLFGLQKSTSTPSLVPASKQDVQKNLQGTDIPLPDGIAALIHEHNQQEHHLNHTFSIFKDMPRASQFFLMGGIRDLRKVQVTRRNSTKAKNEEINRFLDGLEEFADILEEQPDGFDTSFFFENSVWLTGRTGIKQTTLNPQTSTVARHLITVKNSRVMKDGSIFNIDVNKDTQSKEEAAHEERFLVAVAEHVGANIKQKYNASVIAELKEILATKDMKTAIDLITLQQRGGRLNTAQWRLLSGILANAKGIATLDGLTDYVNYLEAQNSGENFTPQMSVEVDGRNNGVAHIAMQLMYDQEGNEIRTSFLEKVGIYLPDSNGDLKWESAHDYLSHPGNTDVYEDLASGIEDATVDILEAARKKKDAEILNSGNSQEEQIKHQGMLGIKGIVGSYYKDSVLSEKDAQDTVSKEGRDAAKPTVLEYIYGSGISAIMRSFLSGSLEGFYSQIEAAVVTEKGKTRIDDAVVRGLNKNLQDVFNDPDFALPTTVDGLLNFVLEPIQESMFFTANKNLYTKAMRKSLDKNFGQLKAARGRLSRIDSAKYTMFDAAYTAEIESATKEKNAKGEALTLGDVDQIMLNLKKAGVVPIITTSTGQENNTGSYLWSSDKVAPEGAKPGKAEFGSAISNTSAFATADNKGQNVKSFGYLTKETVYSDASHKGLVYRIHNIDATNIYEIYGSDVPVIGIHDAIMVSVRDIAKGAEVAAQGFMRTHLNFNIRGQAIADYDIAIKKFRAYQKANQKRLPTLKGVFPEVASPELKLQEKEEKIVLSESGAADAIGEYGRSIANSHKKRLAREGRQIDSGEGINNQFGNNPRIDNTSEQYVSSSTGPATEEAVQRQLQTEAAEQMVRIDAQELVDEAESKGVQWYVDANNVGHIYKPNTELVRVYLEQEGKIEAIKEAISLIDTRIEDTLSSSPDGDIDPDNFKETDTQEVSGDSIISLFDKLGDVKYGNKSESTEHSDYMRKLLQNFGVNTLVDGIKVRLRDAGSETEGKYVVRKSGKQEILLQSASAASANGIRMSTQEAYTHEVLHAISRSAINGSSRAANFLRDLFNEVKNNKSISYESFLNDPATATLQEINSAKRRYNYIFNNLSTRKVESTDPYLNEKLVHFRNDFLHEFFALGLSNENFVKALSKESSAKKAADPYATLYDKFVNLLTQMLSFLNKKFLDAKELPFDAQLRFVATQFSQIEKDAKDQISWFKTATDFANDIVIRNAVKFVIKGVKGAANSDFITKSKYSIVRDAGGIVTKFDTDNWDQYVNTVSNIRKRMGIDAEGLLATTYREVRGVTADVRYWHRLLAYSNKRLDQQHKATAKQSEKDTLAAFIQKRDKRGQVIEPVTPEESTALTNILIRSDLSILDGVMTLNEIAELLDPNAKKVSQEINKRVDIINKTFPDQVARWYTRHAESLAHLMVHGNLSQVDTPGNALLIAQAKNSGIQIKIKHPENGLDGTKQLIEELITLHALRKASKTDRKNALAVMKRENTRKDSPGGIFFVMQMLKKNKADALEKLFDGKEELTRKGFSKELYDENVSMKYGSPEMEEEMLKDGFKRVYDDTLKTDSSHKGLKEIVMYVNTRSMPTAYQRSVMATNQERFIGNDLINVNAQRQGTVDPTADALRQFNQLRGSKARARKAILGVKDPRLVDPSSDNLLVPINDENGNITGWRYVMQESTKDDILNRDNSFHKILGKMEAGIEDKIAARTINNAVVKGLHTEWKHLFATSPEGTFVQIGPKSKNDKHKQIYQMMPAPMRQSIKEVFGTDEVWVRSEIVDLVFGRRKFSIADLGKGPGDGSERGLIGNLAQFTFNRPMMRALENLIQDIYKIVKDVIVIKSFVVLRDNVISNTIMLMMRGVPFRTIIRDTKESLVAIKRYKELVSEQSQLNRAIAVNEASKDSLTAVSGATAAIRRAQIARIDARTHKLKVNLTQVEENIASNAVRKLSESGVHQTIVEDVAMEDEKSNLKNSLERFATPVGKFVPYPIKAVVKTLFVAQDTKIYKFLREVTQVSDFSARYVLHKHNVNVEGMTESNSIEDVVESFINYDPLTHKSIQWLNDMGFWMFTKFFIRIQNQLLRLLVGRKSSDGTVRRGNPAAVGAYFAMTMLGADLATVFDASSLADDAIEKRLHPDIVGPVFKTLLGGSVFTSHAADAAGY
jgi:hypothetical protein